MPVESARHCFVKKLVIASIFVTGFFGVGSILYGSIQSRHEKALTLNKNIRALRMSLSIDKIYNLTQSKFEGTTCLLSNPATCKVLIENLITTLNRLEDYEIVALSTIGLSKRSEAVIKLESRQSDINKLSQKYFKKKLISTGNQEFMTAQQFVDSLASQANISMSNNTLQQNLHPDLKKLKSKIAHDLTQFGNSIQTQSTDKSSSWLLISIGVLILFEVLLFVCVSTIDIANNNADPEIGNEFNLKKIQTKVKPLGLSISLAFGVMIATQFLLLSENKRVELSHCREVNQQDIQFSNLIQTYDKPEKATSILAAFEVSQLCKNLIPESTKLIIQRLDNLDISNNSIEGIEVQNEIMRSYADAYKNKETKMSNNAKNILLFSLIFNVMSMALLAIFLRMDSADIG